MSCVKSTAISLAAVASVALAGCGGGGGGGGAAAVVTPTFQSGQYARTHAIYMPTGTSSFQFTDRTAAGGAASTITPTSTSFTTSSSEGTNAGRALFSGTIGSPSTSSLTTTYTSGSSVAINTRAAGSSSLTSSSYGLVLSGTSSTGLTSASYHQGTVTPQSSMPGNITATYTGTFVGQQFYTGTQTSYTMAGNSSLTANFGAGTVAGTVTGIQRADNSTGATNTAGFGLSMNGTITGNTYTGTAGYTTVSTSAPTGTVTSSGLSGAFYGANAAETAGALRVEGTAVSTSSAIVGSFGGKR